MEGTHEYLGITISDKQDIENSVCENLLMEYEELTTHAVGLFYIEPRHLGEGNNKVKDAFKAANSKRKELVARIRELEKKHEE